MFHAEVECEGEEDKDFIHYKDIGVVVYRKLKIIRTLTFEEIGELLTGDVNNNRRKCSYVKGKKVGKYETFYHDTGLPKFKHGESYEYYKNGKIQVHYTFINGKLNGECNTWYRNGEKCTEKYYVDGKEVNYPTISKKRYPNGKLKMYSLYRGDKLHGEYYEYHENGTPKIQTCYSDGKLHGEYKSWRSM
jgi:hypothetical protein